MRPFTNITIVALLALGGCAASSATSSGPPSVIAATVATGVTAPLTNMIGSADYKSASGVFAFGATNYGGLVTKFTGQFY